MKNFILLTITLLSISVLDLNAQDFVELLKSGNYEELNKVMASEVDVEFKRDRKILNREMAIKSIKDILQEFAPIKWETMHEGKAGNKEDNYIITKVYNAKNKGLRIFIHVEETQGKKRVCSFRFRELL